MKNLIHLKKRLYDVTTFLNILKKKKVDRLIVLLLIGYNICGCCNIYVDNTLLLHNCLYFL